MQKKKYQVYWYALWASYNLNLWIVHSSATNNLKLQTLRRLQEEQHHSMVSLQTLPIYPGTFSLGSSKPWPSCTIQMTLLTFSILMHHGSWQQGSHILNRCKLLVISTAFLMSIHQSWVTDLLNTNTGLQNKECSCYVQRGPSFCSCTS